MHPHGSIAKTIGWMKNSGGNDTLKMIPWNVQSQHADQWVDSGLKQNKECLKMGRTDIWKEKGLWM